MNTRNSYISQISDKLSFLQLLITNRNSLNLMDINIHAENFYRDLLNLLEEGSNYINTNFNVQNAAYIDLIDIDQKKAIQVTSQNDSLKITKSIKGFFQIMNTRIIS